MKKLLAGYLFRKISRKNLKAYLATVKPAEPLQVGDRVTSLARIVEIGKQGNVVSLNDDFTVREIFKTVVSKRPFRVKGVYHDTKSYVKFILVMTPDLSTDTMEGLLSAYLDTLPSQSYIDAVTYGTLEPFKYIKSSSFSTNVLDCLQRDVTFTERINTAYVDKWFNDKLAKDFIVAVCDTVPLSILHNYTSDESNHVKAIKIVEEYIEQFKPVREL